MEINNSKTLLILLGYSCNSNCIFCSVAKDEKQKDRSFEDIIEDLKKGRTENFDSVEFTGGEVSIRGDFLNLVKASKRLGFKKIAISTNGKMFAYEDFCNKAMEAGLNKVTFSLHGASPEIHNAICRTPESFEQIMIGIENINNYGLEVNVSTVVCQINLKDIGRLSKMLLDLNIDNWSLLDLIPEGRAETKYKDLLISPINFQRILKSVEKFLIKDGQLSFFDFPFCFFNNNLINHKCVKIINTYGRASTVKQVGYHPKRVKGKENLTVDKIKRKLDFCFQCVHNDKCGGFWKKYLDFFDKRILKEQTIKNKCLKDE